MLKTNVIKRDYILLIRHANTNRKKMITINAESLESAKLQIPDGWVFMEYSRVAGDRL